MSSVLSLKPSYYEALKRLTLELAGVNLGKNHEFLIETRLSALARQEGFESLHPMIEELFASGQTRLAIHVVSALLERDTHFNQEPDSLDDIVKTILPGLQRVYGGSTLRILSYGCSSGQEPYSLAMAIENNLDLFPGLKYEIVGVDYPSLAIDRARAGRYTHFDVQRGLPIQDLVRYFDRSAEDWVVKETLREKIEFKDFHLLSKLESLGKFHLVVFRNRLPQYSAPAQIRVLRELSSAVRELGYLALGKEEAISRLNFGLEPEEGLPHILRKRAAVVEEPPVDPNVKVPNGRTTFEGAKRRLKRARSELSEMRPLAPMPAIKEEIKPVTPPPLQTPQTVVDEPETIDVAPVITESTQPFETAAEPIAATPLETSSPSFDTQSVETEAAQPSDAPAELIAAAPSETPSPSFDIQSLETEAAKPIEAVAVSIAAAPLETPPPPFGVQSLETESAKPFTAQSQDCTEEDPLDIQALEEELRKIFDEPDVALEFEDAGAVDEQPIKYAAT